MVIRHAPVKLFCPNPREQPWGQKKNVRDKNDVALEYVVKKGGY